MPSKKAHLRDEILNEDVGEIPEYTPCLNLRKSPTALSRRANDRSPLTREEEITRRKNIVFTLFGTKPWVKNGEWGRRLDERQWDLTVDSWARRGLKGRP